MSHVLLLLISFWSGDPVTSATAWIRASDRFTGTGFVIDAQKRLLLTARHVVGDQEQVEVFFREPGFKDHHRDEYLKNRTSLKASGNCVVGRVISKKTSADLAIIQLQTLPVTASELKVGADSPNPGTACRCVGQRVDAISLWSQSVGTIRQTGQLQDGYSWAGQQLGQQIRVHYAQLPIDVGDSGAAVVDSKNQVIGLVSAIAARNPSTCVLISAEEIRRFLGEEPQRVAAEIPNVMRATVRVRPEATEGRFAGVFFSQDHGIILTSALAAGREERVNVIFPKFEGTQLVAEAREYNDRLGLHLSGHLQPAIVLHVDRQRDLALLKVAFVPEASKPVRVTNTDPKPGDKVWAVSHPVGVELDWLLSHGSVRGLGQVVLHPDRPEQAKTVGSVALQLPHQGNCSGGPVVNAEQELLGILASREGPRQELAFIVNLEGRRRFLAEASRLLSPVEVEDFLALSRKHRLINAEFARRPIEAGLKKWPGDIRLLAERWLLTPNVVDVVSQISDLKAQPKTATEWSSLGQVYQRIVDVKQARAHFEEALKLDPKCLPALIGRASLSKFDLAEQDLQAARLVDPDDAGIPRVYAKLLPRTTNDERQLVIEHLTRWIELEPCNVQAIAERANLWLELKEFKKAESGYLRLTELNPGDSSAWLQLATVRLKQRNERSAIPALKSAYRVTPRTISVITHVVQIHAEELLRDDPKDSSRVLDWLRSSLVELDATKFKMLLAILNDDTLAESERVMEGLSRLKSK